MHKLYFNFAIKDATVDSTPEKISFSNVYQTNRIENGGLTLGIEFVVQQMQQKTGLKEAEVSSSSSFGRGISFCSLGRRLLFFAAATFATLCR